MLAKLERLLQRFGNAPGATASVNGASRQPASPSLVEACEGDIAIFTEAARRAAAIGHAPWILREQVQLDVLERALEFTVHERLWLQSSDEGIQHWQGHLLALRHGQGPTLGLLLVCRPDDEAAWQLRFFCIDKPWQGGGHGTRLLTAVRHSLGGVPLRTRLPLSCSAAVRSLEAAGFQRMHIDANEIVSFEAPAEWS